jgi:hypothetical protein
MNNSSLPSVCTGHSDGIGHYDFNFDFDFNVFTALDMDIGADGWLEVVWFKAVGTSRLARNFMEHTSSKESSRQWLARK